LELEWSETEQYKFFLIKYDVSICYKKITTTSSYKVKLYTVIYVIYTSKVGNLNFRNFQFINYLVYKTHISVSSIRILSRRA